MKVNLKDIGWLLREGQEARLRAKLLPKHQLRIPNRHGVERHLKEMRLEFAKQGDHVLVSAQVLKRLRARTKYYIALLSRQEVTFLPSDQVCALEREFKLEFVNRRKPQHPRRILYEPTELKFQTHADGERFTMEFAGKHGVLPSCCQFIPCWYGFAITLNVPIILVEIFEQICRQFPYNVPQMQLLTDLVLAAHKDSEDSFQQRYLKIDYRLELLRDYKEFARVQESNCLDTAKPIPRFWFDPSDFPHPNKRELRNKLAIESDWGKLKTVIYCGFPAGSAFLKCRVEAQKKQLGGGIEYLYLGNVAAQRVQLTHYKWL
jgi:hypothetical protein